MRRTIAGLLAGAVLIIGILCAGCSSYAEPEISIDTSLTQVNVSEEDLSITYDVGVVVSNTGGNNAYSVVVMVILSTPKALPEYRFVNDNFEVGTVLKKESAKVSSRMTLPMTRENYSLITSGQAEAEIEARIMRMTSNIMG